jgi:hypothetical protein
MNFFWQRGSNNESCRLDIIQDDPRTARPVDTRIGMDHLISTASGPASSALIALGQTAIAENRPVQQLAQDGGFDLAPYRALPPAPPLCFFHIPKTAGAALIAWIRSMFDPADAAPYVTQGEYEKLPLDERRYQLYAGHISGRLLYCVPRKTQLVTINRDPVERAISEYYWIKNQYVQQLAANPNVARHKNYMAEAGRLFQDTDITAALAMDTPAMRHFFRDRILHQFARLRGEDEQSQLAETSPVLQRLRKRQLERAVRLLRCFAVVGDYTDLEGAGLLIAAVRGWPAPPILPRIHDLNAPTRVRAAEEALRQRLGEMNSGDCRLFDLTRSRAARVRAELVALCGAGTPEAVDSHHAERYFATAPRVAAFDIAADAPRNGGGWSLPEQDRGQPVRRMFRGRTASTLALLDPGTGDYTFFCHIAHAASPQLRDSLTVTVGGVPLPLVRAATRPWPGQPALVMEWRLPQPVVARVDGRVEFRLQADAATSSDAVLSFGRMGCVPAAPG